MLPFEDLQGWASSRALRTAAPRRVQAGRIDREHVFLTSWALFKPELRKELGDAEPASHPTDMLLDIRMDTSENQCLYTSCVLRLNKILAALSSVRCARILSVLKRSTFLDIISLASIRMSGSMSVACMVGWAYPNSLRSSAVNRAQDVRKIVLCCAGLV